MITRPRVGDIVSPHYPGCLAAVVLDVQVSARYCKQYGPNTLDYANGDPIKEGWEWCISARVRFLHTGQIFSYYRESLYPNWRS
jgi:hypothetical protein